MRSYRFERLGLAGACAVAMFPATGWAQSTTQDQNLEEVEELVVTARSRLPENVASFPGSVTVISLEELVKQQNLTSDLGSILATTVPGLAVAGGPQTSSNFDQTLRGRKPAVLIDGVPVSTPLRDGGVEFRSIHPSALSRIEVIRGSTALYGNGGAGGVINYVTKRGHKGPPEFSTEVGTTFSLTHIGDSFAPFISQSAAGTLGGFDGVGTLYFEKSGSAFDAEGDRLPPNPNGQIGNADSLLVNLFAKVGYDFAATQRLEVSANFYEREQDTDYTFQNGNVPLGQKTTAVRGSANAAAKSEGVRNLIVNGMYINNELFGSSLQIQAYHQEYENMFPYSLAPVYAIGGQSYIKGEKSGGRLDINSPLTWIGLQGNVLWGADYLVDETSQPMVDGRTYVPRMEQTSVAGFLQVEAEVLPRLTLRGGARVEAISLEVQSFTTIGPPQVAVTGGSIEYDATTYNAGALYQLTDNLSVFASYSEGFSVSEIGRLLRQLRSPAVVGNLSLEASLIESYEAGIRGSWSWGRFSLAAYQNESTLGTTVTFVNNQFVIVQRPEKVNGIELAVDIKPTENVALGGTVTTIRGKADTNGDANYDRPLSGRSIPPAKITAYVEYELENDVSFRVQALYSGDRNKFPGSQNFGEGEINDYFVVDATASLPLGPGTMVVGVNNLFNTDYFTTTSEMQNLPDTYTKAPGATIQVKYTVRY